MNYLELDKVKKHLNVDLDFTDDDEYISSLCDVAESIVEKHLDNDLENVIAFSGGELPAPIIHAMYLLIGNFYMNRESVAFASSSDIPLSYEYLLAPFHNYTNSKL